MAHAGFVEQNQYNCTICQEELKDPVTLPRGHNFCKSCINGYWDQGVCVCPQCRQSFTTRLILGTNEALVYAINKIKQTGIRAASAPRAEAAPAPEPSVVVEDEDDDDDDGQEAQHIKAQSVQEYAT